ncbi:MAG TPA: gliding motility-associated C-terminal domain-containing protein, partial [Bacteroidales bacterium]|nr:gliding motility-associated C-terminal domain-containing protein [Bacteroidales bacterium]
DGAIISNTTGGTNPYNYQWSVGSTQNEILNIRDGFYYLTITDANNCISVSAIELIEAEFCLIVFNTFTPNGDGVNDIWHIENIEQFEFNQVWVYNRNGNLVFSSEFYANNWDGTYNGKPLPEATYYYVIEPGAGKDALKGHVTIIR